MASSGAGKAAEVPESDSADGIFQGGGVKGLAFAGAVAAAEDELGVRRWINVAGTSAGAIVAALLVAGFDAAGLKHILDTTPYRQFADYGFDGKWLGAPLNALTSRGIARGDFFCNWLSDCFAKSSLKKRNPTFTDVVRDDLPDDLSPQQRAGVRYRLRVIASDITEGRMLVLPQDIEGYENASHERLTPDGLSLVEAVRMSMSFPFFFDPVTLFREGRPHLIVDGGLLSNFPIWLFDSPRKIIRRKTWGFRLHRGEGPESPPYRKVARPLWPLPLAKAMFFAATEAWDQRMSKASEVRTVNIPTGSVKTLQFDLGEDDRDYLYRSGYEHARGFFRSQLEYMNEYGRRAE